MSILERNFYGNPLYDWFTMVIIVLAVAMLLHFFKGWLIQRVSAWSKKTQTQFDDYLVEILKHTRFLFLFIVAFYFGLQYLDLPPKPSRYITHLITVVLLLQVALWGNRGISLWLNDYLKRHKDADATGATTMWIMGFVAKLMLWVILMLMLLDNLGFNITTLVASLGIGGVAVALAVQNILGDIFASLSIALDKPFAIGDFIVVDNHIGTIEYIGLKTTRVRSLSGEQIIFSNADLLKSRIRNYKRMYERRVEFSFGIVYQTSHEQLARIPLIVRQIIESLEKTRFDRAHFKAYGNSALNFEVVYYVQDTDYNLYMDIQQSINLAIFERFMQEGIALAH